MPPFHFSVEQYEYLLIFDAMQLHSTFWSFWDEYQRFIGVQAAAFGKLRERRDMETVPYCFIEEVLHRSANEFWNLTERAKKLSGIWGELAEAYWDKSGSLSLSYAPYKDDEWRLHYQIFGFDQLKSRTLSAQVVKEMSRRIRSICLSFTTDLRYNWTPGTWTSFDPEAGENDAAIQLLLGLDAPVHILGLSKNLGVESMGAKCIELVAKYPRLLSTFTTMRMAIEPEYFKLVQDAVARGRLQNLSMSSTRPTHVSIHDRKVLPPVFPTSFWVDFFFSESCKRLRLFFNDLDVALGIIKRWEKIDPQRLAPNKIFTGFLATPEDLEKKDVDTTTILLSNAEAQVQELVGSLVPLMSLMSFQYIYHPVDPHSRIYVAFRETGECSLLLH
uniref:Uncharacterized protein n=1 Tax=Steinernema glaseri TaxID=37863 RepID=A0A1I7Z1E3_9BILA